jgi:hypothetical protein
MKYPKISSSFKVKVKVILDRRSAGQSVFEQSTHLELTTRSWLLSDSCGFVGLGRPLWREDGSGVCNCYWPSPAQSFFWSESRRTRGHVLLSQIRDFPFRRLYDSQGHGGGIRSRLHMGVLLICLIFWEPFLNIFVKTSSTVFHTSV